MEKMIGMVALGLILIYIGVAIWVIFRQHTLARSVGASAGFLCGSFLIIPVAELVATFVCWAIVIAIFLAIIGTLFGG